MGVADSGSARKTGQSCEESKDGQVLNFVCTTVATGDPTAGGQSDCSY